MKAKSINYSYFVKVLFFFLFQGKLLEVICLIPELCSMTGLTDAIRADFRVMKVFCIGRLHFPFQSFFFPIFPYLTSLLNKVCTFSVQSFIFIHFHRFNSISSLKDIAQHTRVTPNQRKIAMKKFVDNIYSNPTALEELKSWNLELDRDLLSVS